MWVWGIVASAIAWAAGPDAPLADAPAVAQVGSPPRQSLAYAPRPGARRTIETTSRTEVELSFEVAGQTIQLPKGAQLPGIALITTTEVGAPAAEGVPVVVRHGGLRLLGDATSPLAEQLSGAGDQLVGADFTVWVGPEGRVRPAAFTEAVRGFADQHVANLVRFPAEPVGVGAEWTTQVAQSISGVALRVDATYVVRQITGAEVHLDVRQTLRAASERLSLPGLPSGAAPTVERFVGSGSGSLVVDRATLTATGDTSLQFEVSVSVDDPTAGRSVIAMKVRQAQSMVAP